MIGIYGIFKKDTDECVYVGQSIRLKGRIGAHFCKSGKFNSEEYYAKILEQHFIDDKRYRLNREAYWINKLNAELNIIRDNKFPDYICDKRRENVKGYKNPMYGKHPSEETRKKQSAARKGIPKSEETRKKIGAAHKGKPKSDKQKIKQSQVMKGRYRDIKFVNNGIITKRIYPDELKQYLDCGWKLGCLRLTTSGYKSINNGVVNKRVKPDELQQYLDCGWKIGLIKK